MHSPKSQNKLIISKCEEAPYKFGFVSSGPPFEAHLENLDGRAKSIMIDLRTFVKSLGANVIEEVRPHRVVYAKTLTFRMFLDVEPAVDHLILEVRAGRGEPPVRMTIRTEKEASDAKSAIAQAYEKIR
jgi:hypothetical protein